MHANVGSPPRTKNAKYPSQIASLSFAHFPRSNAPGVLALEILDGCPKRGT
jgi:hypothetical protein